GGGDGGGGWGGRGGGERWGWGDDPTRRAREPGGVRDRWRLAHDAPHRRAVPELQAARSGGFRARSRPAEGGAAGRRAPRVGDGAAQLAAAAALPGRRARRLIPA